jgi:hypothetical protein
MLSQCWKCWVYRYWTGFPQPHGYEALTRTVPDGRNVQHWVCDFKPIKTKDQLSQCRKCRFFPISHAL